MTKPTIPPDTQPSLSIDWDKYGAYLDDAALSDAEKRDCIETLWSLVVTFVDLGFGIDPVSVACGQNTDNGINGLTDLVGSFVNETDQTGGQRP